MQKVCLKFLDESLFERSELDEEKNLKHTFTAF